MFGKTESKYRMLGEISGKYIVGMMQFIDCLPLHFTWNWGFGCQWTLEIISFYADDCLQVIFFFFFKMPLDVIRNELSNSILSLQPEPEIPPELPPPRPHVRCCWLVTSSRVKSMSRRVKKVSVLLCTTIIWQFLVALCYSSQSYTLTCKYANMQSYVGFNYNI